MIHGLRFRSVIARMVLLLCALAGCGRLTDGFFSGSSPTSSASGGSTTGGSTNGGSTTSSAAPTGTTTSSSAGGACDASIELPIQPVEAAMTNSGIPNVAAFVVQDGADANTRLAVYHVFTSGLVTTQMSVPLSAEIGDTNHCSPCVVATYAGKLYTPAAGILELDFSQSASTMSVTFTNAKFAPADGTSGDWCIQDYQQTLALSNYACDLVSLDNGCLTLPETSATASCGDGFVVVGQNCTGAAKTCSGGICR